MSLNTLANMSRSSPSSMLPIPSSITNRTAATAVKKKAKSIPQPTPSTPNIDTQQPKKKQKTSSHARTMTSDVHGSDVSDGSDGDVEMSGSDVEMEVKEKARESRPNSKQVLAFKRYQNQLKQIQFNIQHFSKVATRLTFANNVSAYQNFTILFKCEIDMYGLSSVLETDPGENMVKKSTYADVARLSYSEKLAQEKQKAVYYMLVQCVPVEARTAITTGLAEKLHSGYGAWRTLRQYYIGDENTYLQSLETKFQTVVWKENESFLEFEMKYQSLLSEMEIAGLKKDDIVKKSIMMRAIELSNKHDALNKHVYDRFNVISLIKSELDYTKWLVYMRMEAQKIQDSINTKQSHTNTAAAKRKREEHEEQSAKEANSVADAASNPSNTTPAAQQPPRHAQRYKATRSHYNPQTHRSNIVCKHWLNSGSCSRGNGCRFLHSNANNNASIQGGSYNANNNNNINNNNINNNKQNINQSANGQGGTRSDRTCYEFAATGRCSRNNCRFNHENHKNNHENTTNNGRQGANQVSIETEYDMNKNSYAESYVIERNDVMELAAEVDESSNISSIPRPHRVISDSGDSIHLTPKKEFIRNIRPLDKPIIIKAAFGKYVKCTLFGEGEVKLGGNNILHVEELIYCPALRDTLLSHIKLLRSGHVFNLDRRGGTFSDRHGRFTVPVSFEGDVLSLSTDPIREENGVEHEESNATTRSQLREHTAASDPPAAAASPVPLSSDSSNSPLQPPPYSQLAHTRYGHICGRKLDQLLGNEAADGMITNLRKHASHSELIKCCEACQLAKMKRSPFGNFIDHKVEAPNDLAVADLCGPFQAKRKLSVATVEEKHEKYYLSLVTDVYSRHVHARIVNRKYEASTHVRDYYHSSKLMTTRPMRKFHTDGGNEYNNAEEILKSRGVHCTRTPVDTPQHNGIAERKNGVILDMTRALLMHAKLDAEHFQQDALLTAVYLHNRVNVYAKYGKTQHELYYGHKPNLSNLRVFGCDAYVRIADPTRQGKLLPKAEKGTFIGYDSTREGCWRIRVGDRIIVSRDVQFQENQFTANRQHFLAPTTTPHSNPSSDPYESPYKEDPDSPTPSDSDEDPSTAVDHRTQRKIEQFTRRELEKREKFVPSNIRKSARERRQARQTGLNPDDFGHMTMEVSKAESEVQSKPAANDVSHLKIPATAVKIPSTRRAAMSDSEYASHWRRAEEEELQSIRAHGVYTLTPPPVGINIVGGKWVYNTKVKDGVVVRFKARYVARGFSQMLGVDYEETYSPVMKYKTLRLLLAIVAIYDLELELMDVITAYLNATLKEVVYMQQPEGYEVTNRTSGSAQETLVWRLLKAIYGLKQAGREWNRHFDEFIRSIGFIRCTVETCLYMKSTRTHRFIYVCVYVDDIPAAFHADDREEWKSIKLKFEERFSIKFLGEASWLLNMRITRDRTKRILWLDQQEYTESMLEELGMQQCKAFSHPGTPEELRKSHCPTDRSAEQLHMQRKIPYRRAVGLLTYLANTSRPDIAFSVNLVAQFAQNPGQIHWRAVVAILRYLSGTSDFALPFDGRLGEVKNEKKLLAVYTDASWGGCKDTGRSTTGWLMLFGNCIIDWNCHKQATVALSSCEAEYMAIVAATTSVMWTIQLLQEMKLFQSSTQSQHVHQSQSNLKFIPILLSDNKSAIAIAQNDVNHNRSKHINLKHHFIREQITAGTISLQWIGTQQQMADILTKTLPNHTFKRLQSHLVCKRLSLPQPIHISPAEDIDMQE